MSAQKVRLVADLIRGRSYNEASRLLVGMNRRGARLVQKVLDSAVANASSQILDKELALDVDGLRIVEVRIDAGPMFKRWRARARGMAYPILKRTCHVEVVLEVEDSVVGSSAGDGE